MNYVTFVAIDSELHSFTVFKSLDGVVYYLTRFWGKSDEVARGFVRNVGTDDVSDRHRTMILDDDPRAVLHLYVAMRMSDFGHVRHFDMPETTARAEASDEGGA